jgi:hypothetical protein
MWERRLDRLAEFLAEDEKKLTQDVDSRVCQTTKGYKRDAQ